MAEIDFENEDDLLDEDLNDFDEADADSVPMTGFFTKKRLIIIGSVIGVVFLVSAVLFGLRVNKEQSPNSTSYQSAGGDQEVARAEEKPKPKDLSKIKYEKLFELSANHVAEVLRELSYVGILFKTEQRGKNFTILVDRDDLSRALSVLSIKGLPSSSTTGYALLDESQTLGVTEFDKQIRYIRALSGELEKAIVQFDAIDHAKVQVVLPKERLFSTSQPPVTSSILIRIVPGFKMTDEIVFGVIQLVANAVENLQQENVSVIDTQGAVLSNGIFERMALRDAGLLVDTSTTDILDDIELPTPDKGRPIIPDYEEIKKWYKIKESYETQLEEKAFKQLIGILPVGSFKLAITSEIGPIENGDVVDVRLITTSIVVDDNRGDIFLDQPLKQQIFTTVAGSIGYVRGRDTIQLSKADFALLSPEERQEIEDLAKSVAFWSRVKQVFFYGGGLLLIGGAGFVIYRRRRNNVDSQLPNISDADFNDLKNEIDYEKRVEDIKSRAAIKPAEIATIMEAWLASEKEEVTA